jgi:hypothetical protein
MKRVRVMVGRILLFAGAALALAGCYTAPAEPYYAYDYPPGGYYAPTYYGPTYYGPGYYAPRRPVQNTFVFSYTDRDHGRGRGDRRGRSHGRWD